MTTIDDDKLNRDPLFQPLEIKHLTLKNRIMSTSHASGMDDDAMPVVAESEEESEVKKEKKEEEVKESTESSET